MGKETLTENKKLKTHTKHAKLAMPSFGEYATNEWAFIGAPCDKIKSLVQTLEKSLGENASVIYLDESHNHKEDVASFQQVVKSGGSQQQQLAGQWNKNGNRALFRPYDYCFINGNHFLAEKQIVMLNRKKEKSLAKKVDRLTNVRCFVYNDEIHEPYEFLKGHLPDWETMPIFHVKDIAGISAFIQEDFQMPKLKALILAGGKSVRMGQDKGKINYHGKDQREVMYDLLSKLTDETFISCRTEQEEELLQFNTISDKFIGLGPFGAIASAFMHDPNAAWLIVPCDLPFLGEKELVNLIKSRNHYRFATAFLNKDTDFPEPLISIWEPKMYQQMLGFLAQGYSCPRKVLINSDVELVEVQDQDFMTNVNTHEEYMEAKEILQNS